MKEIYRAIIGDFRASNVKPIFRRAINLPKTPPHVRKALAFIGMRRSGKTCILYQLIDSLISSGVDPTSILYINFEDDRLLGANLQSLSEMQQVFFELQPKSLENKKSYYFLDEIQEIDNWEKFIRRLLDTEDCEVYLSGSSSKMLSKEIATSLRGRALSREVFPLSFKELLEAKKISPATNPSTKEKAHLISTSREYISKGGFPETFGAEPLEHKELIQGYIESVIYKDIVERYDIRNIQALRHFIIYCLKNAASPLSINKVYSDYRSRGFGLGKNTLYEYLGYLEDAYCIFSVPHFELSFRKSSLRPKKIYPVDPGVIGAFSLSDDIVVGSSFESAIFSHLRRQTDKIFYLETSDRKEVDFVVLDVLATPLLIQASIDISSQKTRDREISALISGMKELKVNYGIIVTLDNQEVLNSEAGTIQLLPLWKFLLMPISELIYQA